jgi:hypothetical protein
MSTVPFLFDVMSPDHCYQVVLLACHQSHPVQVTIEHAHLEPPQVDGAAALATADHCFSALVYLPSLGSGSLLLALSFCGVPDFLPGGSQISAVPTLAPWCLIQPCGFKPH